MSDKELIQLKHSDLPILKKKMYEEQNGICPILKVKFPLESFVIDHMHGSKGKEIGENGSSCCRGAISAQSNSWEGKVTNSFIRYGLHKFGVDIWDVLRNLADYLENARTNFIHPTERPKVPKFTKVSYNNLVKEIKKKNRKEKIPDYPKSGKLTKKFGELFRKYKIEVKYYK
ncbi:MAG: endonuclease domain-containing protein [Melioribacteraceae bacterium]